MKLKEKKLLETVSTKILWWLIGFVSNNPEKVHWVGVPRILKLLLLLLLLFFFSFDW